VSKSTPERLASITREISTRARAARHCDPVIIDLSPDKNSILCAGKIAEGEVRISECRHGLNRLLGSSTPNR
jgi:hypothetical protein